MHSVRYTAIMTDHLTIPVSDLVSWYRETLQSATHLRLMAENPVGDNGSESEHGLHLTRMAGRLESVARSIWELHPEVADQRPS